MHDHIFRYRVPRAAAPSGGFFEGDAPSALVGRKLAFRNSNGFSLSNEEAHVSWTARHVNKRAAAALSLVCALLCVTACSGGKNAAAGGGAGGKPVTIRYALGQAKGTPVGDAADQFAKDVQAATNGRVKVQVYYTGTLGTNQAVADQLHAGSVQMMTVDTAFLTSYYQSAQFTNLPYLFTTSQQAYNYWDGPIGKQESAAILSHAGLRVVNAEEFGFHNLVNNQRAVHTVADAKGLRVEATGSQVVIQSLKALGMNPVVIALNETYTALQQKTIDGLELGFASLQAGKQYEVAPYVTISHDNYSTGLTLVNEKFYQTLSASDQKLIGDEALKVQATERTAEAKAEQVAEAYVTAHGTKVVTLTADQQKAFRDAAQPVYDNVKSLMGADAASWLQQYQASQG
jgi:tripartite ATP-independent transporter DctP family solute receptor